MDSNASQGVGNDVFRGVNGERDPIQIYETIIAAQREQKGYIPPPPPSPVHLQHDENPAFSQHVRGPPPEPLSFLKSETCDTMNHPILSTEKATYGGEEVGHNSSQERPELYENLPSLRDEQLDFSTFSPLSASASESTPSKHPTHSLDTFPSKEGCQILPVPHETEQHVPLISGARNNDDCEMCKDLQKKLVTLQSSILNTGDSSALVTEETRLLRSELAKAKEECVQDDRLRAENERLLDVVYALKEELEHEPLAPDVLRELQSTKEQLAIVSAERDELAATLRSFEKREHMRAFSSKSNGFSLWKR